MKQQSKSPRGGGGLGFPRLSFGEDWSSLTPPTLSNLEGKSQEGGPPGPRTDILPQFVIIALHQVAPPPITKSLNPGEDCGRCVGGRFLGVGG